MHCVPGTQDLRSVFAALRASARRRTGLEDFGHPPIEPALSTLFIAGMPRSGSTFLHELLAQDPDNRSPWVWEVMFPLPAPEPGAADRDSRARKAAARLWFFRRLVPQADGVYPLTEATAERMHRMAAGRTRYRQRHEARPAEPWLDIGRESDRFRAYCSRCAATCSDIRWGSCRSGGSSSSSISPYRR